MTNSGMTLVSLVRISNVQDGLMMEEAGAAAEARDC